MKLTAHSLLKKFVKFRELELHQVRDHLAQVYGDHRDWYPVAGLIGQGYLGYPFVAPKNMTENALASMLYAMTQGPGHHSVNKMTAINDPDTERTLYLYATSKADLYIANIRQQRLDRIIYLMISLLIAVSSAIVTVHVKEWIGA